MPHNNQTPIEYLVLNGGGAKGVGYPGMYQAIHDAGLFTNIRSISGASVGSIFAAMIAVGADPEVIRSKTIEENLADQVGKTTLLGPNIIPGLTRSLDTVEINLNKQLIMATVGFLKKQKELSRDTETVLQRMEEPEHELSFNDLFFLHMEYPDQFKTLTVDAMIMGQYKLTVFDHNHSNGQISIARACIASSAMPGLFAPVKINGIYYQDGGIVDPLPCDYFSLKDADDSPEEIAKKTLLFVFSIPLSFSFFENAVNKKHLNFLMKSALMTADILLLPLVNTLYFLMNLTFFLIKCVSYLFLIIPYFFICSEFDNVSMVFSDLSDVFFSLFTIPCVFSLSTVANNLYTRISEHYSDRTILLDSGSIDSSNFKVAPEVARTMHALYYLETMEYILKHKLQKTLFIADEKTFYQTILAHYYACSSEDYDSKGVDDSKLQYMKIKDIANKNHESPTAKALTKATEQLYTNSSSISVDSKSAHQNEYAFFNASVAVLPESLSIGRSMLL
jgi:predicted acylesterase/phospholipase RssA